MEWFRLFGANLLVFSFFWLIIMCATCQKDEFWPEGAGIIGIILGIVIFFH